MFQKISFLLHSEIWYCTWQINFSSCNKNDIALSQMWYYYFVLSRLQYYHTISHVWRREHIHNLRIIVFVPFSICDQCILLTLHKTAYFEYLSYFIYVNLWRNLIGVRKRPLNIVLIREKSMGFIFIHFWGDGNSVETFPPKMGKESGFHAICTMIYYGT